MLGLVEKNNIDNWYILNDNNNIYLINHNNCNNSNKNIQRKLSKINVQEHHMNV